jgi:hypothetical protein
LVDDFDGCKTAAKRPRKEGEGMTLKMKVSVTDQMNWSIFHLQLAALYYRLVISNSLVCPYLPLLLLSLHSLVASNSTLLKRRQKSNE